MTRRLPRACLDCGRPFLPSADSSRCPDCRPRDRGSAHWLRVRLEVLERAGGRCELGLRGCAGTATIAHLARAGVDHRQAEAGDCMAVCAACSGRLHGAGRTQSLVATLPLRSTTRQPPDEAGGFMLA